MKRVPQYIIRRGPHANNAMTFPIEKGVPVPTLQIYARFDFINMAVGDSFFVACADKDWKDWQKRVQGAANRWKKGQCPKKDWWFTTRRVTDGVRCWRVIEPAMRGAAK